MHIFLSSAEVDLGVQVARFHPAEVTKVVTAHQERIRTIILDVREEGWKRVAEQLRDGGLLSSQSNVGHSPGIHLLAFADEKSAIQEFHDLRMAPVVKGIFSSTDAAQGAVKRAIEMLPGREGYDPLGVCSRS